MNIDFSVLTHVAKGLIVFVMWLLCIVHVLVTCQMCKDRDTFGLIMWFVVTVVTIWASLFITGSFYNSHLAESMMNLIR